MNKEDKKILENLVNEMMKVSKTNPAVMIYMQSLMKCYEDLEEENKQLKKQKDDVVEYIKEHKHLNWYVESCYTDNLLRMLGEIDEQDLQR